MISTETTKERRTSRCFITTKIVFLPDGKGKQSLENNQSGNGI
jgi:hypothetical protein